MDETQDEGPLTDFNRAEVPRTMADEPVYDPVTAGRDRQPDLLVRLGLVEDDGPECWGEEAVFGPSDAVQAIRVPFLERQVFELADQLVFARQRQADLMRELTALRDDARVMRSTLEWLVEHAAGLGDITPDGEAEFARVVEAAGAWLDKKS